MKRFSTAALILVLAALAAAPATGPATQPTTAPSSRAPLRILFATSPETHFASTIPADLRAGCDVGDVVFSTNATRDAAGAEDEGLWRAAARRARDANGRFVCDFELIRAGLDNFIGDRPAFDRNLARRAALLAAVRDECPGLRVGVYDTHRVGLPRAGFTLLQLADYRRAERAALAPDFDLVEGYTEDAAANGGAGGDAATLERWQAALDLSLAEPVAGERLVLVMPWVAKGGRWVRMNPWLFRQELLHLQREHATPCVWNYSPAAQTNDVIRELAGRN